MREDENTANSATAAAASTCSLAVSTSTSTSKGAITPADVDSLGSPGPRAPAPFKFLSFRRSLKAPC